MQRALSLTRAVAPFAPLQTLNPRWGKEVEFPLTRSQRHSAARDRAGEVTDSHLLFSSLELHVYDEDVFSADDIIGIVRIDNMLLAIGDMDHPAVITGWFPIVDSIRGTCGELSVCVKIECLSGPITRFLQCSSLPPSLRVEPVPQFGFVFVEEQVVGEDPEYAFADNFRKARVSNSQRERLIARLVAQVKEKISAKVRGASESVSENERGARVRALVEPV